METSFLQGNGIDTLPQFLTSLAIGLLIGLDRERNPSAKAGLRTFALVAIFGTLSAMLFSKVDSPWLLVAGLLLVGAMIIAAYKHDAKPTFISTSTFYQISKCVRIINTSLGNFYIPDGLPGGQSASDND